MDLANEYLRVVAALLPKSQRDDITAELRDTILTRIEDREAELGRPLTDDEIEAVLREIGHPILVAGRYHDGPQHVVGPALYPYWAFTLKVAVTIQLIASAMLLPIRLLTGATTGQALGQAIGAAVSGSITLIGIATIAAWAIERHGGQIDSLHRWRVRDLHMLEFAGWGWSDLGAWLAEGRSRLARRRGGWRGRLSSASRGLGSIAAGAVLSLWWTGALHFGIVGDGSDLRELGFDPGALAMVDWAGMRDTLYWPVLAYCVALILLGTLIFANPRTMRLVGLADLIIGASVVALAAWLWAASPMASAIRVDSVTAFALRMKAFAQGWPVPLESVATLVVAATAFGGVCRMLRGAVEVGVGDDLRPDAAP